MLAPVQGGSGATCQRTALQPVYRSNRPPNFFPRARVSSSLPESILSPSHARLLGTDSCPLCALSRNTGSPRASSTDMCEWPPIHEMVFPNPLARRAALANRSTLISIPISRTGSGSWTAITVLPPLDGAIACPHHTQRPLRVFVSFITHAITFLPIDAAKNIGHTNSYKRDSNII